LFHVHTAEYVVHSFPNASLVFNHLVAVLGPSCPGADIHVVVVAVRVHRVLPFTLYVYGVACAHAHPPSVGTHAVHVPAVHSLLLHAVHVSVGPVTSFFIRYATDVAPVHHTSNILILKSVVHSAGVKLYHKFVELLVRFVHPFVEYSTFVLADGHAVSVPVHVILEVEFQHTLFVNTEHVTVGAPGVVLSICIVAADTCVAVFPTLSIPNKQIYCPLFVSVL